MTDRAFVNEAAQWALETTAGTAVAADKAVRSISIDIDMAGENLQFRPEGHKFNALMIPNMEWTTWKYTGRPTYTEIQYLLESIFGTATVSGVGSTGKKRVYTPADSSADATKTLTIEKGSSVRAEKLAYGLVEAFEMTFSRKNGVQLSGSGIGQRISSGITLTGSPTNLALIPITAPQLDFYIDSSAANLGTTKMLRAFSLGPKIGNKYGPVWPINSSLTSFAGHVELVPSGSFDVMLEADATGMAYLSQYRSGDLIFVRVEAIGPEFESGQTYKFRYDAALGIKLLKDLGKDEDGVTVVTLDTEFVKDVTWNKALNVEVTTAVTTL